MVAYLAVRSGPEKGKQFPLDRSRPLHIGRGSSCEIMLSDPVSSRFHAVVYFEDGNWHLRDTSSRNGTRVNGQKTDHARLLDESVVSIGSTDLQLVEPDMDSNDETIHTQTMVQDAPTRRSWRNDLDDPVEGVAKAGHLIDLYTLSLQLLKSEGSSEVIETVLELLRDRTDADVVAVSFDTGDGRLKPLRVFPPEQADAVSISRALVRRVVRHGEALLINEETQTDLNGPNLDGLKIDGPWSDVIYVPLDNGDQKLGVLHLYRSTPRFQERHFELSVAAGRLLAVGLARAIENDVLRVESRRIADRNADSDDFIGSSPSVMKLKAKIERVGNASGSVLIRGESGAGKELVARAVHRASQRSRRPMLTVNCAAIPSELIESQLFGHKKGSFTGADNDHVGWFQQSHTGTLFLDEIGELTLEGQAKLLRILEGHPFLPVGATEEVLVDVRVLAATNRDLAEFVREKKFREDLFYRLSVFELLVPPLRDRGDDIDILIDHFLDHFRRQHGRAALKLSDAARSRLCEYAWPGNVRQLRNVIDSAVVMADEPTIEVDDLGLRDAGLSQLDTLRIDEWERRLITKALERSAGSVPDAAKLLGISRATAYRKITEYEINR
ncbi:sigma 54-interacting transcriptional regulator [Rubripirellula reticaptiva]|uniref:Regulatory protein LuxO n=1 Tax=Rubripirellula reticaptiva TaxID=2528013 RepID=A0A5C6F6J5_9BACT|nr:sigma 54-interacting transcriptional regulator [Rubripirellula reticaptiva]TWU56190.1 Regulatory protein LuxO [Rubripirellula reticaptiva]